MRNIKPDRITRLHALRERAYVATCRDSRFDPRNLPAEERRRAVRDARVRFDRWMRLAVESANAW